ncbi:unnamed protein product, partial [Polarella glacialis]
AMVSLPASVRVSPGPSALIRGRSAVHQAAIAVGPIAFGQSVQFQAPASELRSRSSSPLNYVPLPATVWLRRSPPGSPAPYVRVPSP